jgi:hypothetical protein
VDKYDPHTEARYRTALDLHTETLVDLASKLYVSASSATSVDGSSVDCICQEGSDQGTVRIMVAAVLQLEALHHHRKQDHCKLAVHYRELDADRTARARIAHEMMARRMDMARVMERREHEVMSELGLRAIRNAIAPRRNTAHDSEALMLQALTAFREYQGILEDIACISALKDSVHKLEFEHVAEEASKNGFDMPCNEMFETSKGLVLAVLAYQVAALTWNGNSKLRTLCILLGYLPQGDEALTGWKFPSLQDRLNFLTACQHSWQSVTQSALVDTSTNNTPSFSIAPESQCSELIRNLSSRSSAASLFANVRIFSQIRKWFPVMYRQLHAEYASVLGRPLEKDDPDPDYT